MTNLSQEEYEQVLKYMQLTNQQNYSTALQIMSKLGFDLQNAIKSSQQTTTRPFTQHQQQKIIENYASLINRRNKPASKLKLSLNLCSLRVKKFCDKCVLYTLPCLHQTLFKSNFKKIYSDNVSLKYQSNLEDALIKSKKSKKPCLLILSNKTINHCLLEFLNSRHSYKINKQFEVVGIIEDQLDYTKFQQFNQVKAPSITMCRRNLMEGISIVKTYYNESNIANITQEQLDQLLKSYQTAEIKQQNIVQKYKQKRIATISNYNARSRVQFLSQIEDSNQRQQISLDIEQISNSSKMIRQQNQIYKKYQEEALKIKLLEKEEQKKLEKEKIREEELLQQRKVRKMSIPQQPKDGDVVRVSFRCPMGETIIRNFPLDQNLELIYNWVETNDDIEFENQKERNFELYTSYPPIALSDKKSQLLGKVFQSTQQKIMIKQL